MKNDSIPLSWNLHGLAYGLTKGRLTRIYPWSASMREKLIKAGITLNHVVYISSMIFWTMVSSLAALIFSVIIFSFLLPTLGLGFSPRLTILGAVLTPAATGGITFIVFQFYPNYRVGVRKIEIEKNLVYATNFMKILTGAGATSEEVFLSLAKVGKIYGVERSARAIIRDVEILGLDILSALDEESRRSPSYEYSTLLQGYISTVNTGGDIGFYLSAMADGFLESRKRLLSRIIGQLNMAGEIFIAALVAFPIILITILSIMGFFGGQVAGGLSPPQIMMILVYVLIPVTALAILVLIDSIMSSW